MCRATTVLLVVLVTAWPAAAGGALRWQDAESWVAQDLAPAVVRQLTQEPRFRGQSVRVVVFEAGAPAARTSAFALALRNQLAAALFEVPGIRKAAPLRPGARLDCTLAEADYYIGLQVTRTGQRAVTIALRTLDVRNNTWVTGYDLSWRGELTPTQRRALQQDGHDRFFRGQRGAPFDADESDVLAGRLARELACAAMRQLGGSYVVHVAPDAEGSAPGVTELIGNNLALLGAVQITSDPDRANAVLRGKAHAVDRELGQFWATLAPVDAGAGLPTLTSSAYVRMPQADTGPADGPVVTQQPDAPPPARTAEAIPAPEAPARIALPATANGVLLRATLVSASGRSRCRASGGRCAALQLTTRDTAAVFVLSHQPRHGLVQLTGDACRNGTAPRILGADTSVTVLLPRASHGTLADTAATSLHPDANTYYALGISGSHAALAFTRHLRALPQRCTSGVTYGLRGKALERWLEGFAAMIDTWRDDVDLRAIRVGAGA